MFWIDHVGLVVRNMPESIAFYTKLLGDGPIDRVEWRGEHAAQVARMLDRPGLELDAVFFRIPHTSFRPPHSAPMYSLEQFTKRFGQNI